MWQTRDSLLGTEKVSLTLHASACPAQLWTIPPPGGLGRQTLPGPAQGLLELGTAGCSWGGPGGLGSRSHWPLSDPDVSAECWAVGLHACPGAPSLCFNEKWVRIFFFTLRNDGKRMAEWAE